MKNPNNTITVVYRNGIVRQRKCQTTVLPSKSEMAGFNTIDDWYKYITFRADAQVNAFNRINDEIAGEELVYSAKELLAVR